MSLIENIRYRLHQAQYRLRSALVPAVLLALFGYFAYHAVSGNHGLLALRELEREHDVIAARAAATATERRRMEAHVTRLRRDNLDPDLLDERARAALGFTNRNELVIYLDKYPSQ